MYNINAILLLDTSWYLINGTGNQKINKNQAKQSN